MLGRNKQPVAPQPKPRPLVDERREKAQAILELDTEELETLAAIALVKGHEISSHSPEHGTAYYTEASAFAGLAVLSQLRAMGHIEATADLADPAAQ
ncbi:MAG: hypothetical protein JWN38_539 [Candidatus Saccharibacteria bacterium]|nr:hypothetical protein [Candidatus Saccharibacteria bacterium]